MSELTLVDFEITSRDMGESLAPAPCRLPRTRLNVCRTLLSTGVINITTLKFCIPVGPENGKLLCLFGQAIRACQRLKTLSVRALMPSRRSNAVMKCPWANASDGIVPFPPVRYLRLYDFHLDPASEKDKNAWKQVVQWSEVVEFTTTCSALFYSYPMPKLRCLKLLSDRCELMTAPGVTEPESNPTRDALLALPPLLNLELTNANVLLNNDVWNHHKNTLTSLTAWSRTHQTIPLDSDFIAEMQQLRSITRLSIGVAHPRPRRFQMGGPQTNTGTDAVARFSAVEPFRTIHHSVQHLLWIEHLEIGMLPMQVDTAVRSCRELWNFLWGTLMVYGGAEHGPNWHPQLRILHINAKIADFGLVHLVVYARATLDGSCVVRCMQLEQLRRYEREYGEDPDVRGLHELVTKWEAFGPDN
ncbi:uncharacterized protein LY89DRAFT_249992 [Mollisia scopiformis]|uniref:Uncharacterized protein n=1 Tax=Mollisia scopiformis TaxID=149040 RepID=A0A194WSZ1_MOLSC|nr:uncharacterized protein LY89DRAFT_249992 [Mollisia scopiformis]KUJ10737.1 hypothetical protein LY89DRAFT_249992 [Mollisia scopiformis]